MIPAEARAESESSDRIIKTYWHEVARRGGPPPSSSRPRPSRTAPLVPIVPKTLQLEEAVGVAGLRQNLATAQATAAQANSKRYRLAGADHPTGDSARRAKPRRNNGAGNDSGGALGLTGPWLHLWLCDHHWPCRRFHHLTDGVLGTCRRMNRIAITSAGRVSPVGRGVRKYLGESRE
jgi:hypothetical protein